MWGIILIQIESVLESGFGSDCKLFLTCKSFKNTRSERFLEPVIKLFQHCRRQLKIHGLRRFMKTNFAPGFTKFISRFRTKVLARTTNCWSLCRTNSLFFLWISKPVFRCCQSIFLLRIQSYTPATTAAAIQVLLSRTDTAIPV